MVKVGSVDISRLVTDEVKAQVAEMADFVTALSAAALRGMENREYRADVMRMLAELKEAHDGLDAAWKQGAARPVDPGKA